MCRVEIDRPIDNGSFHRQRKPLSRVEKFPPSEDACRTTGSCRGFSADCLASVPDGQCSIADLRPKDPQFRLGHLQVGKLHHWHIYYSCIALDLAVQFKLYSGIRAWTQISVYVQVGSLEPTLHCRPMDSIRLQDSAFLSEGTVNHLKKASGEIWPKHSEKKLQKKNYQDEDKKSTINKLIWEVPVV